MTRKQMVQEARARLERRLTALCEEYLPEDERRPIKDGKFWEWEEMADAFDREMTAAFLEELAGLSAAAHLKEPGNCPHCGSGNTKWTVPCGQQERQSKHGKVVLPRQVARCRSCGRSFSPSGAGLGPASPGRADAAGVGQSVS